MKFIHQHRQAAILYATVAAILGAITSHAPASLAHENQGNGGTACEQGRLLGRFAIQSKANDKFLTKENNGSNLKAKLSQAPTSTEDGIFELYDISDLEGAERNSFALRSAMRPNQWWRVKDESKSVILDNYPCRSKSTSTSFKAAGFGGTMAFQSQKNEKWLNIKDNNRLAASLDSPNANDAAVFILKAMDQPGQPNQPGQRLQPEPEPPAQPMQRLDGWWRGDRSGYYSIQTSGSTFQMKGFSNNGAAVNLFTGTIAGNRISGSWKNFCDNRTGNAVLEFNNGQLRRIGGATANSQWLQSSRPRTIQSNPNCDQRRSSEAAPSADLNLSGMWRANDGGTYTIRQSGKTITWDSSGGMMQNTFNGWIRGDRITGFWKDGKSNKPENSGYLTLRIESDNKLVLVEHTGPFTGSTWKRLQMQPSQANPGPSFSP
jgi:hypothetical protein